MCIPARRFQTTLNRTTLHWYREHPVCQVQLYAVCVDSLSATYPSLLQRVADTMAEYVGPHHDFTTFWSFLFASTEAFVTSFYDVLHNKSRGTVSRIYID